MNINLFITTMTLILVAIYVFFKPIKIDKPDHSEIAQLELKDFTVFEMIETGVKSVLVGVSGKRFENRYEVDQVTFTDASKAKLEVMYADHGRYQEDVIYLSESVTFEQEEGLRFESNEACYDIDAALVQTQGDFVITAKDSNITGTKLAFNTKTNRVHAKQIRALFQLEDQ